MPAVAVKSRCQRCGGDLYFEADSYGEYLSCFQCGASHNLDGELELRDPVAEGISLRQDAGRSTNYEATLGEMKSGKELGYKDSHPMIFTTCSECGKPRWVELRNGKPKTKLCKTCAGRRNFAKVGKHEQYSMSNLEKGSQRSRG